MNSVRGNQADAGAGVRGGHIQTAPAQFTVGAVGFGPAWTAEDAMAASIVRLEQENEELKAEVALLREQAGILQAERDEARLQYRSTHALAEALAKTQVELKTERDNWRSAANQAVADRDRNKREWDKCAAELAAVLNGFDEMDAADAEAERVEAAE